MGAALASTVLGIQRPRVALLSNGTEAIKGTPLVQEAHTLLEERCRDRTLVDFVGNTEGNVVMDGVADVVVADGFTGNVALKLIEGVSSATLRSIREAAEGSTRGKLGGLLLRGDLRGSARRDRPRGPGRRLPARPAQARRRAARALHAHRLLAGDPAGRARRAQRRRRAHARSARGGGSTEGSRADLLSRPIRPYRASAMTREAVFTLIQNHLADELDVDPRGSRKAPASRRIWRPTRSTSTRWSRSSRTPTA